MNPRRTPGRILFRHPVDYGSNVGIDLRPARPVTPGQKPPVQAKALSMPANNRFWFHDQQGRGPVCPEPSENHPEESIRRFESRALVSALQYAHLMPERDDLKSQIVARLDEAGEPLENCR